MKKKFLENLTAYAFLSPWILGFLLFSGIPIISSFFISTTNWNMLNSPKFIGLLNYTNMFKASSPFWNSLKVTLIFTLFSVVITLIWALLLAMLLNLKLPHTGIFQLVYFVPAVMPSISLAYAFQLIYNHENGILNYVLFQTGIKNPPDWLNSPAWVMPATIFVCIFTYSTGQMMLTFKASLSDVPQELYEACDMDGAGFFKKFWNVTVPAISPIILFNMIVAAIGSLNNSFSVIYPLTNGGPNGATDVLGMVIYKYAFQNYKMGYAAAHSVMLFMIALLLSGLQFLLSKKWVNYDS